ncbi:MAG TPA: hypothetical protein VIN00_09475 [Candidatus Dormibacteraeota bacterium]|jgi:hypothetical protein
MGPSEDEIDRQIKATREHIDENLGVLEERAATNATHYGRIAAIVVGVVVVAGAGVLIYRRMNRRNRREQLQSMLVEAFKDLPDSLLELPDEVMTRLKRPLPSVKVVVNGEEEAKQPGTLESIVRRVAPAMVSTASSAVINRLTRSSNPAGERESRSTVPAFD